MFTLPKFGHWYGAREKKRKRICWLSSFCQALDAQSTHTHNQLSHMSNLCTLPLAWKKKSVRENIGGGTTVRSDLVCLLLLSSPTATEVLPQCWNQDNNNDCYYYYYFCHCMLFSIDERRLMNYTHPSIHPSLYNDHWLRRLYSQRSKQAPASALCTRENVLYCLAHTVFSRLISKHPAPSSSSIFLLIIIEHALWAVLGKRAHVSRQCADSERASETTSCVW